MNYVTQSRTPITSLECVQSVDVSRFQQFSSFLFCCFSRLQHIFQRKTKEKTYQSTIVSSVILYTLNKKHWMNKEIPCSGCCIGESLFTLRPFQLDSMFLVLFLIEKTPDSLWDSVDSLFNMCGLMNNHSLNKDFPMQHHKHGVSRPIQWFFIQTVQTNRKNSNLINPQIDAFLHAPSKSVENLLWICDPLDF